VFFFFFFKAKQIGDSEERMVIVAVAGCRSLLYNSFVSEL